MKYIEDKDGNGFMIYTQDEVIPPGAEAAAICNRSRSGSNC